MKKVLKIQYKPSLDVSESMDLTKMIEVYTEKFDTITLLVESVEVGLAMLKLHQIYTLPLHLIKVKGQKNRKVFSH